MIKTVAVKFFILIFIIKIALIIGCSKDDISNSEAGLDNQETCDSLSYLGEFSLDTNSYRFIPYPDSITKIIFKDTSDREYIGLVTSYNDLYEPITLFRPERPCPVDPSILIEYYYKPEYKRIFIEFEELDIKITASVSTSISNVEPYEKLVADVFYIFLNFPIGQLGSNSHMSISVNDRTHPNPYESYSDFQEVYEIHDRTFQNVYINEIDDIDDFEILYNEQFGILGLKTLNNPMIDLVFERIEFK